MMAFESLPGYVENQKVWYNWARSTQCHPQKIFYPTTQEQVETIINDAVAKKIEVRAIGSGHSMNALPCTSGYLINTDSLNKILSIDREKHQVTVECGITLKDLYKVLKHAGLAMKNQGFINDQTIVGALMTGTHGTGNTGIMSDFIVAMELIDGQGNRITISADSNPEMLPYARLNLGALGFVYSVTLQCVPLFVLKHSKKVYKWKRILSDYQSFVGDHDYFMVMGHPLSKKALAYVWDYTNKGPTHHYDLKIQEKLMRNKYFNYFTAKAAHWLPGLTNVILEHFFTLSAHRTIREYGYKSLTPISHASTIDNYVEEELAIPVDKFPEAMNIFFELYHKYKKQYPQFELVGLVVCRFVKGSELCALSPTYGRDSAYISFNNLNTFPHYDDFFKEYEAALLAMDGRPHWGKHNTLTKEQVKELYQERFDGFNALRAQLDPTGIFSNDYVRNLFG